MIPVADEFLSEEDLDIRHLSHEELTRWWNHWLTQAQTSNSEDRDEYSHGVFAGMRLPLSAHHGIMTKSTE
ncbi:MAG: hypothetical protein KKG09_01425 [Verrucomicrobia bacterium]|nr:hypothetical protein [Verrucomicrobiota bacterium]MCG2678967.1 hypothetical protein [Kiritimatiellia bacterium]MBU4247623.1 hypothetical protein [Verrucomicrobiota bacterium]MBU4290804.1 hypothetical protein [Verrucomicrobiota bacterium]MBU4428350.1 hypothetical protein [Verrucomicrobiota bacterium]